MLVTVQSHNKAVKLKCHGSALAAGWSPNPSHSLSLEGTKLSIHSVCPVPTLRKIYWRKQSDNSTFNLTHRFINWKHTSNTLDIHFKINGITAISCISSADEKARICFLNSADLEGRLGQRNLIHGDECSCHSELRCTTEVTPQSRPYYIWEGVSKCNTG